MGKAIKGVMGVVAVLIVIVLVALWYVLGNLDRLVEAAIERVGPQVTGTSVLVSGVSISLKEGRGEIRGLTIGNPDGFESPHALRIGRMVLDIDTATITSDPVRITEISVSETDLIAELGKGGMNLKQLMDNLSSGSGSEAPADESAAGPGLVIDRFAFTGAKMKLATPLKDFETQVPDVRLTGIGEKEQGATAAEAAEQILKPIIAAAIKAAQAEAGLQGLEGYKDEAMQRAKEEAGKVTDQLKDEAGKVTDQLKDKLKLGN